MCVSTFLLYSFDTTKKFNEMRIFWTTSDNCAVCYVLIDSVDEIEFHMKRKKLIIIEKKLRLNFEVEFLCRLN